MKAKLTKKKLDSLPTDGSVRLVWDTELRGFGARFQGRSWRFVLKYRYRGRQRWYTVGEYGRPDTIEKARDRAHGLIRQAKAGQDPALHREELQGMPTVGAYATAYIAQRGSYVKPATVLDLESRLRTLQPTFGDLRLDQVTKATVARWHAAQTGRKVRANRAMQFLSALFNRAIDEKLLPAGENPTRGVEKFREQSRERFLSEAELSKLGDALTKHEQLLPFFAAGIRLLILTGARSSEIFRVKWEEVDLERGLLHLPDSKTGRKAIYLSEPAVELLKALPQVEGNPYVIPGRTRGGYFSSTFWPWDFLRQAAGLPGLRIHDLRHSFASLAIAKGTSLAVIGKLLGHKSSRTTQKYAHLLPDTVREAAERVGANAADALKGTKHGKQG